MYVCYKIVCLSDVKPAGNIEKRRQAGAKEKEETQTRGMENDQQKQEEQPVRAELRWEYCQDKPAWQVTHMHEHTHTHTKQVLPIYQP